MKHLKLFESLEQETLKNILNKAKKNGDIALNISVDEFINKYKDPEIGSFEYFVNDEARFISANNANQMTEYVDKFENLGLNVNKLRNLLDDYNRFNRIIYLESDLYIELEDSMSSKEDKKRLKKEIDDLINEQESLRKSYDEFKIELRKITKKAKELI